MIWIIRRHSNWRSWIINAFYRKKKQGAHNACMGSLWVRVFVNCNSIPTLFYVGSYEGANYDSFSLSSTICVMYLCRRFMYSYVRDGTGRNHCYIQSGILSCRRCTRWRQATTSTSRRWPSKIPSASVTWPSKATRTRRGRSATSYWKAPACTTTVTSTPKPRKVNLRFIPRSHIIVYESSMMSFTKGMPMFSSFFFSQKIHRELIDVHCSWVHATQWQTALFVSRFRSSSPTGVHSDWQHCSQQKQEAWLEPSAAGWRKTNIFLLRGQWAWKG